MNKHIDAKEGYTKVLGVRHYVKWITLPDNPASAPTLIFLHEGLGSIAFWKDFPEQLCTLVNCCGIVYDRRGYGKSDFWDGLWPYHYLDEESSLLSALLKEWGSSPAILIGHSDGGTISLLAAANDDGGICGVITEAAHIFVEDITIQGIEAFLKVAETQQLSQKLAKYHGAHAGAVIRRWAERWLSVEFSSWHIRDRLAAITCPVLVLQGHFDEYGTIAQVQGIVRGVSGLAFSEIIPNCGHIPHHQNRAQTLNSMVRFINTLLSNDLSTASPQRL